MDVIETSGFKFKAITVQEMLEVGEYLLIRDALAAIENLVNYSLREHNLETIHKMMNILDIYLDVLERHTHGKPKYIDWDCAVYSCSRALCDLTRAAHSEIRQLDSVISTFNRVGQLYYGFECAAYTKLRKDLPILGDWKDYALHADKFKRFAVPNLYAWFRFKLIRELLLAVKASKGRNVRIAIEDLSNVRSMRRNVWQQSALQTPKQWHGKYAGWPQAEVSEAVIKPDDCLVWPYLSAAEEIFKSISLPLHKITPTISPASYLTRSAHRIIHNEYFNQRPQIQVRIP